MFAPKNIDEILSLFNPTDSLAIPLATGQPMGLMNALSTRQDWQDLSIFAGLFSFPYAILQDPHVTITSGYYGPVERYLNSQKKNMSYLPLDFTGFEIFALKENFRIIAATLSEPDKEGFCTFGTHGAAVDRPFRHALKNPKQLAIAEINPQMPVVYGNPISGDNKIHKDELTHVFISDQTQVELPVSGNATEVDLKIAQGVISLIKSQDTLQFGIGIIPNAIASTLATSTLGDFGIHSELISDGFLQLLESGKVSNKHKGVFEGQSIFTFALGTKNLYDFLDERKGKNNRRAVCLPVSMVNSPQVIGQNKNFVSINSGLMIDLAGQVCSEAVGLKQYSGVGGQLSFVQGAHLSQGGKSILCIKSTAEVNGRIVSNILSSLPTGSLVSTPRHYTQYIVTEYGVANLYGVPDEKRGDLLIPLAHPQFRDQLKEEWEEMVAENY